MRKLLLILGLFAALLLTPLAPHLPEARAAVSSPIARVIVKYKADSPLLQRRPASSAASARAERAVALGQRVGIALRSGRAVTGRSQVVFGEGISSVQLARRLAQEADIEYAVPDLRRRIAAAAVNDPLYAAGPPVDLAAQTGGPVVGQWYLQAPSATVQSSIDIEPAWAITQGNPGLPVAVLDTGVRFDHVDLKTVALGGKLLPGYDMITDLTTAADGNGRDSDPSDPGDFVTAAEATTDCPAQNSSWHGTQTAGVVGALTDNGIGMAGVGRNVPVLPVRVLGQCGGYDSDIIAGMYFAANVADPDDSTIPVNPNPSRVLSMSLGGALTSADAAAETCSSAYQDAVDAVTATGAVVVVAAGNATFVGGEPVSVPANCSGVIAVAALRQVGTKVGFSNIGPEVGLSAPGGNCVNTGSDEPCLYPIVTTSNSGTTTPVSDADGGSIYTDAFADASLGTSFSTPMVAGTAALMLSIQPKLTPAELIAKLKGSARPFPTTGGTAGIAQCLAPYKDSSGNWVDQEECYCTTGTCGAGMLDAGKAVASAAGVQARISVATASPTAGVAVALSAANSLLTSGHSIVSYLWAVTSPGGIVSSFTGAVDGSTASITPTAAGTFQVQLTATDNTGITSSAQSSITVAAAPVVTPPATSSGGGGGALNLAWFALLMAAVTALIILAPRRD
jgi:serine protease